MVLIRPQTNPPITKGVGLMGQHPKSVNIDYIDSGISDHKLLSCSCEILKPPSIYQQLQIRR